MGRGRDHQRRRGAALERDRRQEQHRRAGRRHREQGRAADAERDDHRELRASKRGGGSPSPRRPVCGCSRRTPSWLSTRRAGTARASRRSSPPAQTSGATTPANFLPTPTAARASPISIPTPSARRCSTRCCRRAGPSTDTFSVSTTTSSAYFVRWTATATASRAATAAPTSSGRAGRRALHPRRAYPGGPGRRGEGPRHHLALGAQCAPGHGAGDDQERDRAGRLGLCRQERQAHVQAPPAPQAIHRRGDRHRKRERNETFKVRLSAAKGAPIADAGATVTIVTAD